MNDLSRPERLQIMLTAEELAALDDWRFQRRRPSRAAAVRALLNRGLAAGGGQIARRPPKCPGFGVLPPKARDPATPHPRAPAAHGTPPWRGGGGGTGACWGGGRAPVRGASSAG